ncbi:conserved hypothetical protein [Thiocapsa sp. KS1]|nr:YdcF family protein [Thiocapsa sp. KS1]CRI68125.1 conserved hypothetical protein [Thiocapsa sp. KS1]
MSTSGLSPPATDGRRQGATRPVDWLDLQRLATALIMPLSLGLMLGAVGLALVWRMRWLGVLAIVCGFGLIGVCALPAVAESLMAGLEAGYPPGGSADCEPADAIVVLGGAIQPLVEGDFYPRLHRGSDRLWEAARLYHAGCAPVVAISTSALVLAPNRGSETEAMADLLANLGVPRAAMLWETRGRNTQGNAAFSKALLQSLGIHRVLLVTSAWHLRRAEAMFQHAGFDVVPVGADFRSIRACRGFDCWVPGVGALEASGLAVKEYLGYWIQVGLTK